MRAITLVKVIVSKSYFLRNHDEIIFMQTAILMRSKLKIQITSIPENLV